MTVARKNTSDSPRSRRGLSLWLMLTGVGLALIGLLQLRSSKNPGKINSGPVEFPVAKAVAETRSKTFSPAPVDDHSPSQTAWNNPLAASVTGWLQRIGAESDPVAQEQLMTTFLASLEDANIPAVLGLLQSAKPAELAADLSQRLVRRRTESNPQSAASWVEALPAGDVRKRGVDNVAIVWANTDLTNAIYWVQSLVDETERARSLAVVVGEAARTQPMTALKLAVTLPASARRDALIRRAADEWAATDAPGAVAWAKQIPNASLRSQVLAGEAKVWAGQNPQAAAEIAVNDLPAGRLQNDTVMAIVERWAQSQPEAAAAWVGQFPEGELKQTATGYLAMLSRNQQ